MNALEGFFIFYRLFFFVLALVLRFVLFRVVLFVPPYGSPFSIPSNVARYLLNRLSSFLVRDAFVYTPSSCVKIEHDKSTMNNLVNPLSL